MELTYLERRKCVYVDKDGGLKGGQEGECK